jgi:hypothetical protein
MSLAFICITACSRQGGQAGGHERVSGRCFGDGDPVVLYHLSNWLGTSLNVKASSFAGNRPENDTFAYWDEDTEEAAGHDSKTNVMKRIGSGGRRVGLRTHRSQQGSSDGETGGHRIGKFERSDDRVVHYKPRHRTRPHEPSGSRASGLDVPNLNSLPEHPP